MTDQGAQTPAGTVNFLAGGGGKRAGLAPGPHAVWQAVLRGFAAVGRPPEAADLEDTARRHGIAASQALRTLAAADAWTATSAIVAAW